MPETKAIAVTFIHRKVNKILLVLVHYFLQKPETQIIENCTFRQEIDVKKRSLLASISVNLASILVIFGSFWPQYWSYLAHLASIMDNIGSFGLDYGQYWLIWPQYWSYLAHLASK